MAVASTKPTFTGVNLWAAVCLLLLGTAFLMAGLASYSVSAMSLGALALIAGLLVRSVYLVRRMMGGWVEVPAGAQKHTCPLCHQDLQGVIAPFCPECGTVRPRKVPDA